MIALAEFANSRREENSRLSPVESGTLLDWLIQFSEVVGCPCACIHRVTREIVIRTSGASLSKLPEPHLDRLIACTDVVVEKIDGVSTAFGAPISLNSQLVVCGILCSQEGPLRSSQTSPSSVCDAGLLERLVRSAIRLIELEGRDSRYRLEIQLLGRRIDEAQEQIQALDQLTSQDERLFASVQQLINRQELQRPSHTEHVELMIGFVRSLVSTLDAKDPHTRGHSERVAMIARRIAQHLNLSDTDLDNIYLSSLLHDLGKIGVDDRILSKPEKLTREELQQIKQHPLIGYQILKPLPSLAAILPGVRNHHEAFNGRGYPDRLKGEEIPLMARIISVADSYDAMITDRPYRRGMSLEELEDIFQRGSGEQWDPRIIAAYFEIRVEVQSFYEGNQSQSAFWLDQMSLHETDVFAPK